MREARRKTQHLSGGHRTGILRLAFRLLLLYQRQAHGENDDYGAHDGPDIHDVMEIDTSEYAGKNWLHEEGDAGFRG